MLIVDTRELSEHPEISDLLTEFKVERLEAADYAFLDCNNVPVGIERCEVSNLIQKLRSGELESQLYNCQEQYGSVILLKEGVYDSLGGLLAVYKQGKNGYFREYVYPHTTYMSIKAIEVRLSDMGIEFIDTPNFLCSMIAIKLIYEGRTKPESKRTLFRKTRVVQLPTKLTTNPSVPRLMSLVPRMPEKVAISLIYKYGSIWNILQTPDKELLQIEGLGKTLIKKLRENVGQCSS